MLYLYLYICVYLIPIIDYVYTYQNHYTCKTYQKMNDHLLKKNYYYLHMERTKRKKRKDGLEGSLDRVLFAAELEF